MAPASPWGVSFESAFVEGLAGGETFFLCLMKNLTKHLTVSPFGAYFHLAKSTKCPYDLFWKGWQESDLGIVFGGNPPSIINDQEDGWGMRASGKFIKEMDRFGFVFGPNFKYWNIEDSKLAYLEVEGEVIAFIEPANTSIEIGGMFGFIF